LPGIMANGQQLQEVFVSIILRALEVMPKEGEFRITTALLKEANAVEIKFSDTGSEGIKKAEAGPGLSLAISEGIITRYNGRMEVEIYPGKGADITITFRPAKAV